MAFLVALFILWQVMRWSFAQSAEACIVAGVLLYSALNIHDALRVAWSGPDIVGRVSRLVGVLLYVLMRYIMHYGFWRSVMVWAVLWLMVPILVGRRAAAQLGERR